MVDHREEVISRQQRVNKKVLEAIELLSEASLAANKPHVVVDHIERSIYRLKQLLQSPINPDKFV